MHLCTAGSHTVHPEHSSSAWLKRREVSDNPGLCWLFTNNCCGLLSKQKCSPGQMSGGMLACQAEVGSKRQQETDTNKAGQSPTGSSGSMLTASSWQGADVRQDCNQAALRLLVLRPQLSNSNAVPSKSHLRAWMWPQLDIVRYII